MAMKSPRGRSSGGEDLRARSSGGADPRARSLRGGEDPRARSCGGEDPRARDNLLNFMKEYVYLSSSFSSSFVPFCSWDDMDCAEIA